MVHSRISYLFTRHPKSVNMTYWQHNKFSMYLAYSFFTGSIKAMIHAFFPFLFITSSSDLHILLNKLLCNRLDTQVTFEQTHLFVDY